MKSVIFLVNLIVLLLSLSFGVSAQGAGSLDTTFGSGGIVITNLNAPPNFPFTNFDDFVIQPDNKIVVVGFSKIGRFNQNGTRDTTFGDNGVSFIANCRPRVVDLQSDGKIIFGAGTGLSQSCFGRLNSNGSLDTSFNGNGTVSITIGVASHISSLISLPNGKILASGSTALQNTANNDYAIVKLNSDGSLDTTFGTGGRVATELGSNEYSYNSEVQPDGKIILVGDFTDSLSGQKRAAIVRYNNDGTIDTSFGNNGKVFRMTNISISANDVKILSDGKIIIAGSGIVPTRFLSNGTFDTEFSNPGWLRSETMDIQSNGKIIVSGTNLNGSIIIARYNSNGTLDNSFGSGGIVTNTGGITSKSYSHKISLAPDGKILLGGTGFINDSQIVLARYLNNRPPFIDFDGDSKTDVSIFRPSNGQWWFLRSSDGGNYALQFGVSTDKIVPADYTGDGKTDVAIYRPSAGEWYILRSEDFSYYAFPFGISTDIAAPGDYDGDGKADAAVFRASTGTWYINNSATGGTQITNFGINGDVPVSGDFDGDTRADIAVFRRNTGDWWILRSSNGTVFGYNFGATPLVFINVVPGDYTGDGKTDAAFIRDNNWFILRSEPSPLENFYVTAFGIPGDIPAPGDYDGDGRFDIAVFRPSEGVWYVKGSTAGVFQTPFGTSGDIPTPSAFVR